MRVSVGVAQFGTVKPSRLASRPASVATISGLRTSCRAKPLCACRAMGHTAAMLNIGTHTPISTAISNRPCGPASRSASARQMKELKRNAICALAAWSRRSMCERRPGT